MSCVIKHPPPQNKPRCIYGDERFQSLKIDQWQEPEVTRSGNRTKTNGNYPSAIHSDMHTYTFIHTHWTLSVSFMHSFTSLACSENTTCECQQHPLYSVNCQTVFNSHYFTSEVCTWQENFFFSKHMRCTPKTRSANTNMHTNTNLMYTHTHLHFPLWTWSWGGRLCPVWPLAPLCRLRPALPWRHLTVGQIKDRSKD